MNIKTFFKILFASFYSKELYISVFDNWKHWGLGFLIRFSVLVTFTASVIFYILISLTDFDSQNVHSLFNNIPEMNITDGKASFADKELKSPLIIKSTTNNQNIFIFDLDTNNSNKYQNQSLIAFVADKIVLNALQSSPISVTYEDLISGSKISSIDGAFLLNFLKDQQQKLLNIVLFVGVPLGSIIYFILTLLKASFFSSIAYIFSNIFRFNLSFKQLTRIAIITNVPSVLVSSVFSILLFNNIGSEFDQLIVNSVHLFYFIGSIILYLNYRKTLIQKHI